MPSRFRFALDGGMMAIRVRLGERKAKGSPKKLHSLRPVARFGRIPTRLSIGSQKRPTARDGPFIGVDQAFDSLRIDVGGANKHLNYPGGTQ